MRLSDRVKERLQFCAGDRLVVEHVDIIDMRELTSVPGRAADYGENHRLVRMRVLKDGVMKYGQAVLDPEMLEEPDLSVWAAKAVEVLLEAFTPRGKPDAAA